MIKKIAVGMSGGVDSSVSALMLKEAGYEVIGITMILKPTLTAKDEEELYKEANDAAAVCKKIGIPHYVPDFREDFQKNVVDYFVNEYKNGRTPNPCIKCNFSMKFGMMLEYALSLGCDAIATGHYAKIEEENGQFYLKKSDSLKDQSYFLYSMNQHQLSHTLFPLINKEKVETREIALAYDLPVATKSDSQDICFVKDGDYASFIDAYTQTKPKYGNFIDDKGKVLGVHKGIYKYTVGQRRGLGIALGERMFVSEINANDNTVRLSSKDTSCAKSLVVSSPHFINLDKLEKEMHVTVKTRFRAKPTQAKISPLGDKVLVEFDEEQKFLTPGQFAVFYDNDTVIGGGTID